MGNEGKRKIGGGSFTYQSRLNICSCSKGNYYAAGEMLWRLVFCKFGWEGKGEP